MSSLWRVHLAPRRLMALAAIGLPALVLAFQTPPAGQPLAMHGLAIVLLTVALFATGVLPSLVTIALFGVLALTTGVAPVGVLLAGFWANATLLIFGGLIIGAAAQRSGLGAAVSRTLMSRFEGSYARFILGLLIGSSALSFLVPSTSGRLAITIPIVLSATRAAGYAPGSNGYNGAVLTAVAGNFLISYAILPSNLMNVIVLGAAESLYGLQFSYGEYLLVFAPILGVVKSLMFWGAVLLIFPAPAPCPAAADATATSLGRPAKRLAILLALTVAIWATDVLHGLKPGWVAVGAALVCLLPPVSLVTLRESFDINRLTAVASVPAILGLASVLTYSGAGTLIGDAIRIVLPLDGYPPAWGFVSVALISAVTAIVATIVGTIAIVTPLIANVSDATGLPLKMGLVAEMTGLQSVFFHFEAVPIMVGIAMGAVAPRTALRLLIPLALSGLAVILPLQLLWVWLIGAMP
jgi:di/tricarboxylate transporter